MNRSGLEKIMFAALLTLLFLFELPSARAGAGDCTGVSGVAAPVPVGTVSGRVTDASGKPLNKITIGFGQNVNGSLPYSVKTAADGTFFYQQLPPGSYFVQACDCGQIGKYPTVWYPNVWDGDFHFNLGQAAAIQVTAGQVTGGIDFVLTEGGLVALTLKDGSGNPIDASVPYLPAPNQASFGRTFLDVGGEPLDYPAGVPYSGDHNNGTYSTALFPVGRRIFLEARPASAPFSPLFFDGKPDLAGATPIDFSAAGPVPITMTLLDPGHLIKGSFSFQTTPIQVNSAQAYAWGVFRQESTNVKIPVTGTFSVEGLPDDDYFLSLFVAYVDSTGTSKYAYPRYPKPIHVSGTDASAGNLVLDAAAAPQAVHVNESSTVGLRAPSGVDGPVREIQIWTDLNTSVPFTASSPATWLIISPGSGTLSPGAAARTIRLHGNAAGLAPGTYRTILTIDDTSGSGAGESLGVELEVASAPAGQARLITNPAILEFISTTPSFGPLSLDLTNTGTAGTNWSAHSALLNVFPSDGQLSAGATENLKAAVLPNSYVPAFGSLGCTLEFDADGSAAWIMRVSANVFPVPTPVTKTPAQEKTGIWGLASKTIPITSSKTTGAAGSTWSSDVTAGNVDAIVTAATIEKDCADGTRALTDTPGLSVYFTPYGSKNGASSLLVEGPAGTDLTSFVDPVTTVFNQPKGIGVIEIRADVSAQVGVWSRSSTPSLDGRGSYGQEVPALETSSILAAGETGIVPVLLGGGFRSNLIMAEVSGQAADVSIQLEDSSGAAIGAPITRSLAGYEQSVANNVLAASGIAMGYARVTISGAGRVGLLGSVVDNGTNDPTTIIHKSAAPIAGNGRILFPVVTHAAGLGGTTWRSDVWFVNAGSAAASFQTSYSPEGGAAIVAGQNHSLGAGQMVALTDIAQSEFGVTSGKGALLIDVTAGDRTRLFSFSRTFNVGSGGTFGQGVWAVEPDREIGAADKGLALFGLEKSALTRTNLILFETSGNPATVTVDAPEPSAFYSSFTAVVVPLAAYQFIQINDILAAVGYPDGSSGAALRLRVTSGTGRVTSLASMVDNVTGDATTVPAYKGQ